MTWLICILSYLVIGLITARIFHKFGDMHPAETWKMMLGWPLIILLLVVAVVMIAFLAVFYTTPINLVEHGFSFKKWSWRQIE